MKDAIKQVLSMPSFWIIVLYMILPVDLIEDSIPIAGVIDGALVTFACIVASKMSSR